MDRDQLKALIRTEPTLAATFAEVDAEYEAVAENFHALGARRSELRRHLDEIAQAKEQLKALSPLPPSPPLLPAEEEASADEPAGEESAGEETDATDPAGEGETSDNGEQEPAE